MRHHNDYWVSNLGYGSYLYLSSAIDVWEKLATSAIGLGILLVFGTVIYERRKEWLTDPYRNVYR